MRIISPIRDTLSLLRNILGYSIYGCLFAFWDYVLRHVLMYDIYCVICENRSMNANKIDFVDPDDLFHSDEESESDTENDTMCEGCSGCSGCPSRRCLTEEGKDFTEQDLSVECGDMMESLMARLHTLRQSFKDFVDENRVDVANLHTHSAEDVPKINEDVE